MENIRKAIKEDRLLEYKEEFYKKNMDIIEKTNDFFLLIMYNKKEEEGISK